MLWLVLARVVSRTANAMTGNGLIAALLKSRFHKILSGSTALISVTGRKTGRTITLPVNYAEADDRLVIVSKPERTWWRNIGDGAPVQVLLRGRWRTGNAKACTGDAAAFERFLHMRPVWASRFGVKRQAGGLDPGVVARVAAQWVVIEVSLATTSLRVQ